MHTTHEVHSVTGQNSCEGWMRRSGSVSCGQPTITPVIASSDANVGWQYSELLTRALNKRVPGWRT
jgi:hypothetical protein